MSLQPGAQVQRYTIQAILGEGAMAKVYAVEHDTLETRHALKILTTNNRALNERLIREGKVQAKLRHPNAVAVTDVFDHAGSPVLLMEMVEGPDLDEWLEAHTPDLDEALAVFGGILAGVRSAHEQGITHRDLKPGNVLLHMGSRTVVPKVADFGLAKALERGASNRTQAGIAMGTPSYMAPEQIRDASSAGAPADVFSLGCILYELVTHEQCFPGEDIFAVFARIATLDYVEPKELRPDLPDHVVQAIKSCLTLDPESRCQSCDDLAEALFGSTINFPTVLASNTPGGKIARSLWIKKEATFTRAEDYTSTFSFRPEDFKDGDTSSHTFTDESEKPAEPASAPASADTSPQELDDFDDFDDLEPPTRSRTPLYLGLAGLVLLAAVGIIGATGAIVLSYTGSTDVPVASVDQPTTPPADPGTEAPPADTAAPKVAANTPPPDKNPTPPPKQNTAPKNTESPKQVAPVKTVTAPIKPPVETNPVEPPPVEVVPAAPVSTPKSSFAVTGDAVSVYLLGEDGRQYGPGENIPPGNYQIYADFGTGAAPANQVQLRASETTTLRCQSLMSRCAVVR